MAEESRIPVTVQEVVVPEAEKVVDPPKGAVAEAEKVVNPPKEEVSEAEVEKVAVVEDEKKKVAQKMSFKEETNVVSELPESHRKALEEFKKLIQEALNKHEFTAPPTPPPAVPVKEEKEEEDKKEEEKKDEEQPPSGPAPGGEKQQAGEAAPHPAATATAADEPAAATVAEEPSKTEGASASASASTEEAKADEEKEAETTTPATITSTEEEKTVEAIKETIVEVTAPVATKEMAPTPEAEVEPEEVSIWGIRLLADERSDVILLKFLRARDFRVKDALTMIKNTVRWRKVFGVDALLDEDLGSDYEKVVFTQGLDKQGRPVCYNVFGEFQNKELYQNTFSDAEKRKNFLRWLIQFLEKTIRTLDFSPKGINSFVLVNDLKNSPGFGKRDLYKVIDRFLQILQDNYPEFVAKQLCINVSWWYLAYNWIYLTVFTPRSKSKFVFASPSKTPETIFKYAAPEQVPIQFGGHSKDGECHFSPADTVTQVTIKPGSKHLIDFPFTEPTELVWELRVIGWEVSYGAEFLPAKEGSYTVNITKPKKMAPTDEPVICDTFKVSEPGKVVITIDNPSSKKKNILYRSKVKASE